MSNSDSSSLGSAHGTCSARCRGSPGSCPTRPGLPADVHRRSVSSSGERRSLTSAPRAAFGAVLFLGWGDRDYHLGGQHDQPRRRRREFGDHQRGCVARPPGLACRDGRSRGRGHRSVARDLPRAHYISAGGLAGGEAAFCRAHRDNRHHPVPPIRAHHSLNLGNDQ